MENEKITLAHGAGGSLSRALMERVILPAFGNEFLQKMHDGAALDLGGKTAFTTDSFVVAPRFFPGGDIGKLAVCGTVNDLAMTGAVPRYISCALILEEGLPIEELRRILHSMKEAAAEAKVAIVTGDTKVVGKGAWALVAAALPGMVFTLLAAPLLVKILDRIARLRRTADARV